MNLRILFKFLPLLESQKLYLKKMSWAHAKWTLRITKVLVEITWSLQRTKMSKRKDKYRWSKSLKFKSNQLWLQRSKRLVLLQLWTILSKPTKISLPSWLKDRCQNLLWKTMSLISYTLKMLGESKKMSGSKIARSSFKKRKLAHLNLSSVAKILLNEVLTSS